VALVHKHVSLVLLLATGLLSRVESVLRVTSPSLSALCDRLHGNLTFSETFLLFFYQFCFVLFLDNLYCADLLF